MIAKCAVHGRRSLIGCLDEPAIFKMELSIKYEILVYCQIADCLSLSLDPNGLLVPKLAAVTMESLVIGCPEVQPQGVFGYQKLPQEDVCQGQVFATSATSGCRLSSAKNFLASSHTWKARIP